MKGKIGAGSDEPEIPAGKSVYRFNLKDASGEITVSQAVGATLDDAIGVMMEKTLGVSSESPDYDPMNFWDEYRIDSWVLECSGSKGQTDNTGGDLELA